MSEALTSTSVQPKVPAPEDPALPGHIVHHAGASVGERSGVRSEPLTRALGAALDAELATDDRVLVMGEDVGALGGVFRVTEGLQARYGSQRVLDTPLAESGIIGTAIGLALRGYRPVCEIQFDGFVFPAFDQITTQLAKLTYRTRGDCPMPVVIRVPYGGHIGAVEHHQESPEAYFAHTPGLRVVAPSTPNDGYWMLRQAIRSNDPVIFLEPKSRYWVRGEVDYDHDDAALTATRIVRAGTDVTLVGWGAMISTLERAADIAANEGRSIEIVDLRSLSPIDWEPLLQSVVKTGRLVVAQEAPGFASLGSEIAATIAERAFFSLQAPVLRVAAFDTPFPAAALEGVYLPDADRVLEAVDRSLAH